MSNLIENDTAARLRWGTICPTDIKVPRYWSWFHISERSYVISCEGRAPTNVRRRINTWYVCAMETAVGRERSSISDHRLSSWQRTEQTGRENMKFIDRSYPIPAFDVLSSDRVHVIICWIAVPLILTYWIISHIRHKPKVKYIVPGEANTDFPLPRVYINDSNWLTRLFDPLVAFSRGPELIKKGYKLVIRKLFSNWLHSFLHSFSDFAIWARLISL